jgi:hypothetical protein
MYNIISLFQYVCIIRLLERIMDNKQHVKNNNTGFFFQIYTITKTVYLHTHKKNLLLKHWNNK